MTRTLSQKHPQLKTSGESTRSVRRASGFVLVGNLEAEPDYDREVGLQYGNLVRFDADPIIHSVPEPLLAAEIPLSRLDAHMAEQELDLFQLAASLVTQTGACSAQIVRGHAGHCAFRTRVFHYTPDDLRAKPVSYDSARFVYRPKDGLLLPESVFIPRCPPCR